MTSPPKRHRLVIPFGYRTAISAEGEQVVAKNDIGLAINAIVGITHARVDIHSIGRYLG